MIRRLVSQQLLRGLAPRRTLLPAALGRPGIAGGEGRRQEQRRGNSNLPTQFNTHQMVQILISKNFTYEQAEAVLEVLEKTSQQIIESQARLLATKGEHIELKAELSEKVFNSTLKFDIAQRHMRELLERDFNNLRSDLRMLETKDFNEVRGEITNLEKKFLLQKQAEDEVLKSLQLDIERVEKRILQYGVGFAGTILAVGLGIARLFA